MNTVNLMGEVEDDRNRSDAAKTYAHGNFEHEHGSVP